MLCTVDGGKIADIDSPNGCTVTFAKPGTYYITAQGFTQDEFLIIPPYCVVNVEAEAQPPVQPPYFQRLEFMASAVSDWVSGVTFSPATLNYPLTIKAYGTSQLTLLGTTSYDTESCTATAQYIDINGQAQAISVNSGAITYLRNIPFGSSTLTITLADKADEDNKSVYTFAVTRPRDTTSTLKSTTGVVLVPHGRQLLPTLYNGKAEGTFFRVNDDGSLSAATGIAAAHYNYQAYVLGGLDAFALTLAGTTNYLHLRYSVDSAPWQEIASGAGTEIISFGGSDTVSVAVEAISDKAFTDNLEAGQNGFATVDTDGKAYNIKITRVELSASGALLSSAGCDAGSWYPAFDPSVFTYNILVPNGTTGGTLAYTLPDGARAYVGTALQQADEQGIYTLALTTSAKSLTVKNADESLSNTYSFALRARSKYDVPDAVTDYLVINSQYTNNSSYGLAPEMTLTSGTKSLGNFGGYITYYYKDAVVDHPNNPYGVDFYISGNAFATSGDYGNSGEPGQVWVSEDGEAWYALAGSQHYEDTTLWDYTVKYNKTPLGKTAWQDNYGNSGTGAGPWPLASNYYLNNLLSDDGVTLSGILLMCQDGTITGNGTTASYAATSDFGYVDAVGNSAAGAHANPYTGSRVTSGFDLAWAVDANGEPVSFSSGIHYIKVVTASNIYAGAFGEKSTEVSYVIRTAAAGEAVGRTAAPKGVTISDATGSIDVDFEEGKQVYSINVGEMSRVDIGVVGAPRDANIYINNSRGQAASGFTVAKDSPRQVRIIVQAGEQEPLIYLLNLVGGEAAPVVPVAGVDVYAGGAIHPAQASGEDTYTLTVGNSLSSVKILPRLAEGATFTVNGAAAQEEYALAVGANTFSITAVIGATSQTVVLTINRKAPPAETDSITVYLTVVGDRLHGEDTVHAYAIDPSGLEVWISGAECTAQAGDTVASVVSSALDSAGIPYIINGGNYISSINGLAEMDNGPRSGWMYLLNGKHPDLGVGQQTVKDGDSIIVHYTDDFKLEEPKQQEADDGTGTAKEEELGSDTPLAGLEPNVFADVDPAAWYAEAIAYVTAIGLMTGTDDGRFDPGKPISRAMLVTVLYRLEGQPEVSDAPTFVDVPDGQWYSDAVAWAQQNGIVNGYGRGFLGPNDNMTRQQIAAVLYRYAGYKNYSLEASAELAGYSDTMQIDQWAAEAMTWAVGKGLIVGITQTTLEPAGPATRAHAAAILMRFCRDIIAD